MRKTRPIEGCPKEVRRARGWSLERVAVFAGVSSNTALHYELSPLAVADERRRARLARVYAALAAGREPRLWKGAAA